MAYEGAVIFNYETGNLCIRLISRMIMEYASGYVGRLEPWVCFLVGYHTILPYIIFLIEKFWILLVCQ